MDEADLLHVATGLIPISFSMAIISHDSLTKHKVSLIEWSIEMPKEEELIKSCSQVYLVRAAQASAAVDKTWTRAAKKGRVDGQSMDLGNGDRTH